MSAVLELPSFDWRSPDYTRIYANRAARLQRLRAQPELLPALRAYYAEHVGEFIADWGTTVDPRNAFLRPARPVQMPFCLFPKQAEWVKWVMELAHNRESGLTEKSRDCGVSWLAVSIACTLCLLTPNVVIGFGSAKEDKVDRSDDPDSLFWKARTFIKHLPAEFRGSWSEDKHSLHMRLIFPETGSAIIGEAGDNIGRGGRSSIYFVDEAAFLERPKRIESSLASNTDCRVDVSSVNGMANVFAEKRHSGRVKVFTFSWRDDPRKGEAWYSDQKRKLDPITLAAEVDLDYRASAEGTLIPSVWIQSAIGAAEKLGIVPSGARIGALDVADEGRDKNAFAGRHGILLEHLKSWSGEASDIFATTLQAFACCDEHGYTGFRFDSDGLGAGVRGDARIANDARSCRRLEVTPYRSSAAVADPDGSLVEGRTNKDFFANLKAQSWWSLRIRFQATYRAIAEGAAYDPDSLISIPPDLPEVNELTQELSQPTYSLNAAGKIVVDKAPAGFKSPNLADAVAIAFSPFAPGEFFPEAALLGADGNVPALPGFCNGMVGVVAATRDAVAVLYGAILGRRHDAVRKLVIVDWDLRELRPGVLESWLPAIGARLHELHRECRTLGPSLMFAADLDDFGTTLQSIADYQLTELPKEFPPPAERPKMAQAYVRTGLVELSRPAYERTVSYRSTTRNYLRDQLAAIDVTDQNALGIAFATAVLIRFLEI